MATAMLVSTVAPPSAVRSTIAPCRPERAGRTRQIGGIAKRQHDRAVEGEGITFDREARDERDDDRQRPARDRPQQMGRPRNARSIGFFDRKCGGERIGHV